jgi:hypothetical protein
MIESAEELVRRYLMPNETLLWTGRPKQGLLVRPADAIVIPVSLLWAGFFLLIAYSLVATNSPLARLWVVPLVLIGLYGLFGRFVSDARQRARTVYALTSQRVMIITKSRRTNVTSLALARLVQVELSEHRNGSGTITFGPLLPWHAELFGSRARSEQLPQLEGIADSRRVYDQIRLAQSHA